MPHGLWFASYLSLWLFVLFTGFLLLGTLRQLGLLNWRLEQLSATTPSRINRSGLPLGTKAPDFSLTDRTGARVSLRDFRGRQVLLVFIQPGCGPCQAVIPTLTAWQKKDRFQVVIVTSDDAHHGREHEDAVDGAFPVLLQQTFRVSRLYQAYSTPFAFLLDEQGVVRAKGIINSDRHIQFLLASAREEPESVDGMRLADSAG